MTNKELKGKSKCDDCMANKSLFHRKKSKCEWDIIVSGVLINWMLWNMLKYCLKCKIDTESVDSKVLKTKNGRPMLLSKCAVCGSKKSKFMKEQERLKNLCK